MLENVRTIYIYDTAINVEESKGTYFSWQEIPVSENPGGNYHSVIPMTIITIETPGVIT